MRALIVVDVQNDFCEGGSVQVVGGAAVAGAVTGYLATARGYRHVVATQDFHIDPGDHFSDRPDFQTSWPPHCVAGSPGADFHPNFNTGAVDAVFRKGAYSAAYSGFEGVDDAGTPLLDWLRQHDVDQVDVVGLATDFCVQATAEDAVRAGLSTRVLLDLTAGTTAESTAAAVEALSAAGIGTGHSSMMASQDHELVAAVERSPRAAAAHDRAGWVELFTTDGRIEDPVGSRPHVGHAQIGRFYDTFIGPRDITFDRDLDIVRGHVVLRDLKLGVVMGSVTMTIPAFLRYDLREYDGEWNIAELRAYWDLPAVMLQFLRNGAPAVPVGLQLSSGLLSNQRLLGTAGFAAGFRRPGSRPKRLLAAFLSAITQGNEAAAIATLSSDAVITIGDDDATGIPEISGRLLGAGWTKVVGAGSTIAVSLNAAQERGVMFADLTKGGRLIARIRYFPA